MGPTGPQPVIVQCTSPGDNRVACSASIPQWVARDGGPATTSTSAVDARAWRSARPSDDRRSAVKLRLPLSHRGAAGSDRKRSPPGGSTLITSAPKSARIIVAIPPTGPVVTSTTRNPSRAVAPREGNEVNQATYAVDGTRAGDSDQFEGPPANVVFQFGGEPPNSRLETRLWHLLTLANLLYRVGVTRV